MVGAALAVGSAYAGSKLNLIINEAASVPEHLEVKLEDGKVFVPIDRLAEEFKGKATYDPDKNEVRVTLPDAAKLSIQVSRLEDALKPSTPEDALDTWVKGVQTRSGALQYAVLSPELREQTKKEFEEHYWTTGGSSPHMDAIENLVTESLDDNTVRFSFDYRLVASNYNGQGSAVMTVQQMETDRGEGWFITNVKMKDPGDTGITIGVEPMHP
ncbi:copper amine oxidase N-terminal domain-containing protein [Paenibacillus sp. P25]|nr:copper amine oxidase N-terminal domain-containing protein [Paenibacillus sp. P25]